jgi:hypothetical protein
LTKALDPIDFTVLGMVSDVSLEQSLKTDSPIEATPSLITAVVRPKHLEKAAPPITFTLLGIVTDVRLEQL